MPAIYISPAAQPNAFATGRNPHHAAVAVTQGLLQIVNEDELRGVLAHELSHVANRDILISSVAAAVAMGITFMARMAMWGAIFGGGGGGRDRNNNMFGALAMMILAPIAAVMLQMALSRSREFEADHSGAELLGNGDALASALEKIDAYARQVPMKVDPALATAYIINPLPGASSTSPVCSRRTRPRPSASPACAAALTLCRWLDPDQHPVAVELAVTHARVGVLAERRRFERHEIRAAPERLVGDRAGDRVAEAATPGGVGTRRPSHVRAAVGEQHELRARDGDAVDLGE